MNYLRKSSNKILLARLGEYIAKSHRQISKVNAEKNQKPIELNRPLSWSSNFMLTKVIESKEEFKHVLKLLPHEIVPEPPTHGSYPTPSGWQPPKITKSNMLPYAVLRTRFHNFPIYLEEREGGSRKLVRIKNIQGDIWVSICLYFFNKTIN